MVEGLVRAWQLTPRQLLHDELRDGGPRRTLGRLDDHVGVEREGVGASVTAHTIHGACGRVVEACADAHWHITTVKAHLSNSQVIAE